MIPHNIKQIIRNNFVNKIFNYKILLNKIYDNDDLYSKLFNLIVLIRANQLIGIDGIINVTEKRIERHFLCHITKYINGEIISL